MLILNIDWLINYMLVESLNFYRLPFKLWSKNSILIQFAITLKQKNPKLIESTAIISIGICIIFTRTNQSGFDFIQF